MSNPSLMCTSTKPFPKSYTVVMLTLEANLARQTQSALREI